MILLMRSQTGVGLLASW